MRKNKIHTSNRTNQFGRLEIILWYDRNEVGERIPELRLDEIQHDIDAVLEKHADVFNTTTFEG